MASQSNTKVVAKPSILESLSQAINTVDNERLRSMVKSYCQSDEQFKKKLEMDLLVCGRDVIPYHADSESENQQESEGESSEEDDSEASDEDGVEKDSTKKERKQVVVMDNEMTPRFARCLNCEAEFDVTENEKGDCLWHPGHKEVDHDSELWADHDEDCHGHPESFDDDPDYEEGFIWSCCERSGGDEGCKCTKHKVAANLVRNTTQVVPPVIAITDRKRKMSQMQ